ncbi:SseB family protein [Methanobrevibacter sp.]|uniref:SseB family protein n=1 Tax=Methanobrevibacter sp. TaxID=66852 RepID=UPI0025FEB408|nr:SseB family protein [Methanobrevibacter sp.]MBQ2665581.1 SseB family protein [Methanobrevibacter sp.]
MANHKHLRVVLEDIFLNNNELTQDLKSRLVNEFRYSNLFIPAKRDEFTLNFIIYEDEGMRLTPLFTDKNEFDKFFADADDIELMENSFELYRNILLTSDLDGYIINPATEKYVFDRNFVLDIKNVPKTNFYTTDTYSKEEIGEMRHSGNPNLEDFIGNPNNIGDFEALFEEMSKSTLLAMMVSDVDLSPKSENGIVSLMDIGPMAQMYTDRVGGVYACIFSSEDKMRLVGSSKFRYSQVINLAMLVNFVLSEDMDGIVLNPESDNVLIPRSTLLRYSLGFERYANDEKLSNSIYYMFPL